MPFRWAERNLRCSDIWDVRDFRRGLEVLNERYDCRYFPPPLNVTPYDSRLDAAAGR